NGVACVFGLANLARTELRHSLMCPFRDRLFLRDAEAIWWWIGVLFIGTLAGCLLCVPLSATAQPVSRVPRIGYISPGSPSFGAYASQQAFLAGLRDLGYVQDTTSFWTSARPRDGRSGSST